MGSLVTLLAIGVGFLKRHSALASFFILLVLWVLFSLNTGNADYQGYEYLYNNQMFAIAGSGQTAGYQFLSNICYQLGFDYLQFKCIVGTLGLALLFLFARRYTNNAAFVLALYLVIPFFYDVVQLRFFLAASVAVFFTRFIIERTRFGVFLFLFGLLIAFSVHPASLLFSFLLLGRLSKKAAKWLSIGLFLVILIAVYSGLLVPIAALFVDQVKFEVYFSEMARFGFLPYWASSGLILVLVQGTRKLSDGNQLSDNVRYECSEDLMRCRQDAFMEFFDRACFAILPLSALVPLSVTNFYRPIRSMIFLAHIYCALLLIERKELYGKMDRIIFAIGYATWIVFTSVILYQGVFNEVVLSVLNCNLLWNP